MTGDAGTEKNTYLSNSVIVQLEFCNIFKNKKNSKINHKPLTFRIHNIDDEWDQPVAFVGFRQVCDLNKV